ncbi:MAG TPA: hypothetical protein DEQ56_01915 [Bacteroidetes bacterium]|nr:hypothetical protein [Bacteroidota bacterium]
MDDTFDLILLLIGVNNQYQGLPLIDFEKDFKGLLDTAISYSGNNKNHVSYCPFLIMAKYLVV